MRNSVSNKENSNVCLLVKNISVRFIFFSIFLTFFYFKQNKCCYITCPGLFYCSTLICILWADVCHHFLLKLYFEAISYFETVFRVGKLGKIHVSF